MAVDNPNEEDESQRLEHHIKKAINEYSVDTIKAAADRAFPPTPVPYFDQILRQLLGPVAVGTLIAGIVTWIATQAVTSYQETQQTKKTEYAEYVGIYQKYKQAHRERWLQGGSLQSALTWGFPLVVISNRKAAYDAAVLETNRIYPYARDYLARVVVPAEIDSTTLFSETIEILRRITTIHDNCITGAYGIRNDWDEAIWADKLRENPNQNLRQLKGLRDCNINKQITSCTYDHVKYSTTSIRSIYMKCTDTLFKNLDEAITKDYLNNKKMYLQWQTKTTSDMIEACDLKKAIPSDYKTEDCETIYSTPPQHAMPVIK